MTQSLPLTYFDEPCRALPATINRQHLMLASNSLVVALLGSFPEPAAIINRERQIVLGNEKLARLTGLRAQDLLGLRVGEAIGCEYAAEPPNGCGTTRACELCGAAKAIRVTGIGRRPAQERCELVLAPERGHAAMNFRVWTTPVDVEQEAFTVFAIKDSTDEQRRNVLERMFFHDVLNSAGSLQQLLDLLPAMPPEQAARLTETASHLARQVVEEIQAQRDLAAAERGELEPRPAALDVRGALEDMVTVYRHHSAARDKQIVLDAALAPAVVRTDPMLLRRVLGNLLKNALEASRPGETVTVRCHASAGTVFEVHNQAVMPEAVKLQVFRRSFSTKQGVGRGVGTYSARLLAERHLGGELRFRSEAGEGTTFVLTLPADR